MKTFTINKAGKMGEHDQKYGQCFWCETNEQLEPVKFNLMQGEVVAGDTITCETVELKESNKGIEYHQLKKVKVVTSGVPQPIKSSPSEHKLDQILELVREIHEATVKLEELTDPIFDESGAPIRGDGIPF